MGKMSKELQQAVDALAEAICESEEYKSYVEAKRMALDNPDKLAMIRQAQILRERLQSIPEHELNNDYADRTQTEYEELMEDTSVYKYTKAQLAVAGICREVFSRILDAMEF